MTRCACCDTPTPLPERILPLGVMAHKENMIVLWNCPGARAIDYELLRWGFIALAPWSCGTTRATPWERTTPDLRQRAFEAERLHLAMKGWI